MAFNLTGFDDSLVFQVYPAIHVSYFAVLCLPALILSSLCIVALFFAEAVDINIRIILINIFAAELTQLVGTIVLFLGHPARVDDEETIDYSCNFFYSAVFCGALVKLPVTSLYAIVVYIYIKHGASKLKWYVVVVSCVFVWGLVMPFTLLPYTSLLTVVSNHGFCYITDESLLYRILLFIVFGIITILSTSVTVTFGYLTFCYVKKNALTERAHKGVTRLLKYLIVGVFITLFNIVLPPIFGQVVASSKDNIGAIIEPVSNAITATPAILTPIFTIVLLRPVRDTFKSAYIWLMSHFRARSASIHEVVMDPIPALIPEQAAPVIAALEPAIGTPTRLHPEQPMEIQHSESTQHSGLAVDHQLAADSDLTVDNEDVSHE